MKYFSQFIVLLSVLLLAVSVNAQIYQCKSSNGATSFQDTPCLTKNKNKIKKQMLLDDLGREIKPVSVSSTTGSENNTWFDSVDNIEITLLDNNLLAFNDGDNTIKGKWKKITKDKYSINFTYFSEEISATMSKEGESMRLKGALFDNVLKQKDATKPQSTADSTSTSTSGLSLHSLQGKWRNSTFDNDPDPETQKMLKEMGDDLWVFENNTMTVISGGKNLRPDSFKIVDNTLVFDYLNIDVVEITATTMTTGTASSVQTFEKL